MRKLLVLIAMLAMVVMLPTVAMAVDEEKTMATFSYGLASGGLGTAHTVGIGFQFQSGSKIELQYLAYIDSRGGLELGGWSPYKENEYTASLTPRYQGIVTMGVGSSFGDGRKYGYLCIEGIFGSAKGQSVRTYEEYDYALKDYIVRQEFKSDNITYAGLGVGPDIEIFPVKRVGFSAGGRIGFLRANTAFGEDSNNQMYFRGSALIKIRL